MLRFEALRERILAGGRLASADAEFLFQAEVDVHAIGRLADEVCRRKNGGRVYYNINAHLNPTNICGYRCRLCAFSCEEGDSRGYVMADDAILARGQEAADAGCTELHIVGGAHPGLSFAWYVEMIRRLHAAFPQLHLKAFTAVEIDWFSKIAVLPEPTVLDRLIEAGLGSLPGGGAEIFAPEIRQQICAAKADAKTWLGVHRVAHRLGLRSNATMLFGHVETPAQRVDHLLQLRDLQDETGGFQAFIPLAFHPANTPLAQQHAAPPNGPSGLDALRTIAIARLVLDNFDHIKAYWISLGISVAQIALAYGADDLDGTVRQERIHHDAGALSPQLLGVDQICRMIWETGHEPIQRDSLYRPAPARG